MVVVAHKAEHDVALPQLVFSLPMCRQCIAALAKLRESERVEGLRFGLNKRFDSSLKQGFHSLQVSGNFPLKVSVVSFRDRRILKRTHNHVGLLGTGFLPSLEAGLHKFLSASLSVASLIKVQASFKSFT